jgi:hypothetical protein
MFLSASDRECHLPIYLFSDSHSILTLEVCRNRP